MTKSYYKIGKTLKHQTGATNTRLSISKKIKTKTKTNIRLSKKIKKKTKNTKTKSYYKIGNTLKHSVFVNYY